MKHLIWFKSDNRELLRDELIGQPIGGYISDDRKVRLYVSSLKNYINIDGHTRLNAYVATEQTDRYVYTDKQCTIKWRDHGDTHS